MSNYEPAGIKPQVVIIDSTTTALGTNLTLIDSILTQSDDYWNNMVVVILSGNSIGQTRRISDFDAASDTITVDTAFASVIASGTRYSIVAQHAPLESTSDATAANQVLILADTSTIKGDTQTIEDSTLKASPTAGSLSRFIASGGTALGTQLPDSKSLYDCLSGSVSAVNRVVGKIQILEVTVSSDSNAGAVTLATITDQPCLIKSIVVHAVTAQTATLTTCAVTGGASNVITFLSNAIATLANLDAIDKQVSWTGAVRLSATKTIVMTLVGTGGANVDLKVTIEYQATVAGGYLV